MSNTEKQSVVINKDKIDQLFHNLVYILNQQVENQDIYVQFLFSEENVSIRMDCDDTRYSLNQLHAIQSHFESDGLDINTTVNDTIGVEMIIAKAIIVMHEGKVEFKVNARSDVSIIIHIPKKQKNPVEYKPKLVLTEAPASIIPN